MDQKTDQSSGLECGSDLPEAGTGSRGLRCPLPRWGRRLGALAFAFFLIKGLLWLAVPALVAMGLIKAF